MIMKHIIFLNEKHNESLQQMSKEALSNLLGGIGYFHGSIKQKQKKLI